MCFKPCEGCVGVRSLGTSEGDMAGGGEKGSCCGGDGGD